MAETVNTPLFGSPRTPEAQLEGLASAMVVLIKQIAKLFPEGTHLSVVTRNPQLPAADMVFSTEGQGNLGNIIDVVKVRMDNSKTAIARPREGMDEISG
jgi:hypothetical protein